MALPADNQKRLPSQEHLLLDYVHRLEKHKEGRRAAHLHLSRLRPFNRRDQHLRAAMSNFEGLIKNLQGQLFLLQSGDMFFVFKEDALAAAETAIQKTRFMFSDDPLVAEEATSGRSFVEFHDVSQDYDTILRFARSLVDMEQRRANEVRDRMDTRAALKARQKQGEPLTPEILARLEVALQRADLSNLVRRQFVCTLNQKMMPEAVFSELFISIQDLRQTLLPGVNVTASRWLFQHLTETLDRRMLAMLTKTDHVTISGIISFNLNVSTLLAPEFMTFDENIPASRRGNILIELQAVDMFSDLSAYQFAKEFVAEKGYRVCLDGVTHDSLLLVHVPRLGADIVKLVWHPEMFDAGEDLHSVVRDLIETMTPERVVLCRVDTREAIDFGRTIGLTQFQGRYVENLIAEDNRRRELLRLKRRIERS